MPVVGCTPSTRGNILNNSHLNHFWVQPEILKVLTRVLGVTSAVVPISNIKSLHSASYRGTTYNQHLSANCIHTIICNARSLLYDS